MYDDRSRVVVPIVTDSSSFECTLESTRGRTWTT